MTEVLRGGPFPTYSPSLRLGQSWAVQHFWNFKRNEKTSLGLCMGIVRLNIINQNPRPLLHVFDLFSEQLVMHIYNHNL